MATDTTFADKKNCFVPRELIFRACKGVERFALPEVESVANSSAFVGPDAFSQQS
jgi:hypothetical protein